jgi:hypothetical protein
MSQYSISLPIPQAKGSGGRPSDDLTPPNHVFFSDHLATVNAYNLWEAIFHNRGIEAAYAFCSEKYLTHSTLDEIRRLRDNFRQYLCDAGFVSREVKNYTGDDEEMVDENSGDEETDTAKSALSVLQSSREETLFSTAASKPLEKSSSSYGIMRCALCAGLYPQVVRVSRFEDKASKTQAKGVRRKAPVKR